MNRRDTEKLLEFFKTQDALKSLIKQVKDDTLKIALIKEGGIVGNVSPQYIFKFVNKDIAAKLDVELKAVEDEIKKLGGDV